MFAFRMVVVGADGLEPPTYAVLGRTHCYLITSENSLHRGEPGNQYLPLLAARCDRGQDSALPVHFSPAPQPRKAQADTTRDSTGGAIHDRKCGTKVAMSPAPSTSVPSNGVGQRARFRWSLLAAPGHACFPGHRYPAPRHGALGPRSRFFEIGAMAPRCRHGGAWTRRRQKRPSSPCPADPSRRPRQRWATPTHRRCRLRARSLVMAMRRPPRTTLERVVPPRTACPAVSGLYLAQHRATRSASIMAASTCFPALTHSP